jgi:rhodanese-related sulfurtransferase
MEQATITAENLLKKLKQGEPVFVLDVRDEDKYRMGSLEAEGVRPVNIPYVAMKSEAEHVTEQVSHLPKGTEIVTVCTTGNKARKAAELLREKGYSAVSLEGGLTAWKEQRTT